jgi:D-alanyl-D-alanine carboxypeptidase (penicillin-binding protein 5/6)
MRLMQSPWLKYGILLVSFFSVHTLFAQKPAHIASTQTPENKALPVITTPPAPPNIVAKAFVLMDFDSQHILASQNKDERVEPASLTKMMTVYVIDHALAQGKIRPQDLVSISAAAWKTGGSRTFLNVNSRVPVQELIRGIIIQSGNDASVAMAEHLAGSEESFAELMNTYAKSLGMTQTHFVNATGLPHPDHYTSTQDLAILANALIRDFPESYSLYSQKEYEYQGIKQLNRNRLLWRNEAVDGIKTGFTDSAGYCLAASGKKGPMRLIAIVMGTKSDEARTVETNKLINYGFNFFETHKLYPALTPVKQTRIWMGKEKNLNLGLSNDLYITIPKGTYRKLQATIEVKEPLKAPTQIGQAIGTLSVQLHDQAIIQQPIVALQNIDRGSLLSRVYDYFHLSFEALWKKLIQT